MSPGVHQDRASTPHHSGPCRPGAWRALLLGVLAALCAPAALAYDTTQHLWRERLLFIVAPTPADPDARRQRELINQRGDALRDRDMRVFELYARQGRLDGRTLATDAVQALRGQLGVHRDDRLLILVGKDGGEKRRGALQTDLRELFVQIDGMPMRRDEIRAKARAGIGTTPP